MIFIKKISASGFRILDAQLTWLKNSRTIKVDRDKVFAVKNAATSLVDTNRLYELTNRIFETKTGKRLKILTEPKSFIS